MAPTLNKRKAKQLIKSEEHVEMLSAQELQSIDTAIKAYQRKLIDTDWIALGLPELEEFRRKIA